MRSLFLIPVVALAACSGENQGWNPNYRAEATPYGDYLRARELALTGQRAEPPRVIPAARPFKAPTAAEIAGHSPVQVLESAFPAGQPRKVPLRGAPAVDPVPPSLDRPSKPATITTRTVVKQPVVVGAVSRPAQQVTVRVPRTPAVVTAPLTTPVQPLHARSVKADGCSAFASAAAAQRAFESQGGPLRDPLGLDADGDGRACRWTGKPAEPL